MSESIIKIIKRAQVTKTQLFSKHPIPKIANTQKRIAKRNRNKYLRIDTGLSADTELIA